MQKQNTFRLVEILEDMTIDLKDCVVIDEVWMDEGLWP